MVQNHEKDLRIATILVAAGMLLSVLFVTVSHAFIYPLILDLGIIVYVFLLPSFKKSGKH